VKKRKRRNAMIGFEKYEVCLSVRKKAVKKWKHIQGSAMYRIKTRTYRHTRTESFPILVFHTSISAG
jgi:hypothetical protein